MSSQFLGSPIPSTPLWDTHVLSKHSFGVNLLTEWGRSRHCILPSAHSEYNWQGLLDVVFYSYLLECKFPGRFFHDSGIAHCPPQAPCTSQGFTWDRASVEIWKEDREKGLVPEPRVCPSESRERTTESATQEDKFISFSFSWWKQQAPQGSSHSLPKGKWLEWSQLWGFALPFLGQRPAEPSPQPSHPWEKQLRIDVQLRPQILQRHFLPN